MALIGFVFWAPQAGILP